MHIVIIASRPLEANMPLGSTNNLPARTSWSWSHSDRKPPVKNKPADVMHVKRNEMEKHPGLQQPLCSWWPSYSQV